MKINIITFACLISLIACSHKMNPDKYKKSQIIFGSGGGFTNLVNEYHLLENGQLYHKKSTDTSFSELSKQDTNSVKILFAKTKILLETNKGFREPGNMYYFIKFKHDSVTNEIIWGASKEITPAKAKDLYKELMNLVHLK